MLPSFRLIAATFLCGFVVVFAGLRLAISLNSTHAAFPVMAAHAAPISVTPIADTDMRRGQSSVPVMYDPRFVVSTASLNPIRASLVVPPPAAPPLDITPPAVGKVTKDELPPLPGGTLAKPSAAIAAVQPAASPVAAPAQSAASQAPEPLKPQAPVVAAIDARPSPEPAAPPSFDIPLPEPAAVDLSPSATDQDRTAAVEPTGALSDSPGPDPAPMQPTVAIPMPEPKAAVTPRNRAKAKIIRKPRARTARRAEATDPFGGFGNSASQPFGAPK